MEKRQPTAVASIDVKWEIFFNSLLLQAVEDCISQESEGVILVSVESWGICKKRYIAAPRSSKAAKQTTKMNPP
jgi:hypothetical protein